MINLQESISINDYHYSDNLISQQKQATIYKATHLHNKNLPPVCFKGYPETYLSDPVKEKKLIQEMNVMWKLRGKQNIVQIMSQHLRDKMVFIICEYCQGGDLEKQIERTGAFAEEKAVSYIKQIIKGYRHIHEQGVVHRLMEPSNIFITDLSVKIGDFSCAILEKEAQLARLREQLVGSLSYQAPEVLEHYIYSELSDIYSIGLIFLTMLMGQKVFDGQSKYDILSKMKETDISELIGNSVSIKTKHFLMQTLTVQPERRMSVEDMLDYNFDMIPKLTLNKLLTFNGDQLEKKKIAEADKNKKKQKDKKLLMADNFGDTSPIRGTNISNNPQIPLLKFKASVDMDKFDKSNASNNKQISIFIPSKGQLFSKQKKDSFFKLFQADKGLASYEPSLLIQNEKEPSMRSYNSKASKNSKNSKKSQGFVLKSLVSNPKTNSQISKGSFKSQSMQSDSFYIKKISIQSKPQSIAQERPSQQKTSHHNHSIIEVQVHSPINSQRMDEKVEENDVLANWLLSLVDLTRYINRTCYHLQKVGDSKWNRLQAALLGQKSKILRQVSDLHYLKKQQIRIFKKSQQYDTLIQIIERYQQKSIQKGSEQQPKLLLQLMKQAILQLYSLLASSISLAPEPTKALLHLTHTYEMLALLFERGLQEFYVNSDLEELLEATRLEVRLETLVVIHDKLIKNSVIK